MYGPFVGDVPRDVEKKRENGTDFELGWIFSSKIGVLVHGVYVYTLIGWSSRYRRGEVRWANPFFCRFNRVYMPATREQKQLSYR